MIRLLILVITDLLIRVITHYRLVKVEQKEVVPLRIFSSLLYNVHCVNTCTAREHDSNSLMYRLITVRSLVSTFRGHRHVCLQAAPNAIGVMAQWQ